MATKFGSLKEKQKVVGINRNEIF